MITIAITVMRVIATIVVMIRTAMINKVKRIVKMEILKNRYQTLI